MPIYTFTCDQCGADRELFASVAEYERVRDRQRCECGKTMRRQIKAVNIQTDDTFFAGMGTLLDQCNGNEKEVQRIVRAAKRQGYTPGANDFYIPTLAQRPGDPDAFISQSGGRSQIRSVCEARGISCEGMVNVKGRERQPKPKVALAERIVNRYLKDEIARDPSIGKNPKKRAEARERIIAQHSFKR